MSPTGVGVGVTVVTPEGRQCSVGGVGRACNAQRELVESECGVRAVNGGGTHRMGVWCVCNHDIHVGH